MRFLRHPWKPLLPTPTHTRARCCLWVRGARRIWLPAFIHLMLGMGNSSFATISLSWGTPVFVSSLTPLHSFAMNVRLVASMEIESLLNCKMHLNSGFVVLAGSDVPPSCTLMAGMGNSTFAAIFSSRGRLCSFPHQRPCKSSPCSSMCWHPWG